MRRLALAAVLLSLAVTFAHGDDTSPLERRAKDVAELLRPDAGGFEKVFSKEFLAQVPPARMKAIASQYHAAGGKCVRVELVERESAFHGKFDLHFEKGYKVRATLAVAPDEPHEVVGLFFGPPVRQSRTVGEVVRALDDLPGEVSLELVRLDPPGRAPLAALLPDKQLAIGSSFKLWVLAELVRQVEAGKRRLEETVALESEARSLPSGALHTWPVGSPLTLHTLASLMISTSDNTATDQLIRVLGRQNVEACLAATGHAQPEKNVPFLTTLDMFRLKGDASGTTAKRWLGLDLPARRAFLEGELPRAVPREKVHFAGTKPSFISEIEWFASARDLCEVMDWLRRHTESGPAAPLREVLAINPGIALSKQTWTWTGFKGGSEPGVLNLTFLLRSAGGDWYALSAGWNDTDDPVDTTKLLGLVQRLVELAPLRY